MFAGDVVDTTNATNSIGSFAIRALRRECQLSNYQLNMPKKSITEPFVACTSLRRALSRKYPSQRETVYSTTTLLRKYLYTVRHDG